MTENHDVYSKIAAYIDYNPTAVLGTINLDGTPYGAVVHVCTDDHRHMVYFITKTETRKFKNLSARDRVCLTIANPIENSTLQADGRAIVVHDAKVIDSVVKQITRAYATAPE